jgi:hypothetical protein
MNVLNYLLSFFQSSHSITGTIQSEIEVLDGEEWEIIDIGEEEKECCKSLSFSETVGHGLAYQLAKGRIEVGTVVNLEDIYGREVNFRIHQIETNHAGLNGYVLMPTETGLKQLVIVWTGTMNIAGARIDTQVAPGEDSYRRREALIVRQINQYVAALVEQNLNQPIEIFITGHSLGSSLSQLTFHSLQRAICENIQDEDLQSLEARFVETMNVGAKPDGKIESLSLLDINHLTAENISKLHISIKNSPGVHRTVSSHSSKMAPKVKAAGVEQIFDFLKVHGDPVQMCGAHMILDRATENSVKIRQVKKFPHGRYNRFAKITRVAMPTIAVSCVSFPFAIPVFLGLSMKECFLAKKSHTMKFFTPFDVYPVGSEFHINQDRNNPESAEALALISSMKRHCPLIERITLEKNNCVGRAHYDPDQSFIGPDRSLSI